jgi:hypothetical protein
MAHGVTDRKAGGQYYFDPANKLFWTWDTPELISAKFDAIVRKYKLGGVMAWSLGEDSFDWSHIRAMAKELAKGSSRAAPKPARKKPAPKPVLKTAPASARPLAPKPSKTPISAVWVDGTAKEPASDLASDPVGAPTEFTQQVHSADDAEASTPQQNQPLPRTTQAKDDLPFSPEYLNLMKSAIYRRLRRAERMNIVRANAIETSNMDSEMKDRPDMDNMKDVKESKHINDPKDADNSAPSKPSKPSKHLPKFELQGDVENMPDKSHLPKFKFLGDSEPMGEDGDAEPLGEVLGSGWVWALRKRVLSMFW